MECGSLGVLENKKCRRLSASPCTFRFTIGIKLKLIKIVLLKRFALCPMRCALFGAALPVNSLQQLFHVPDLLVACSLTCFDKRTAVLIIQRALKQIDFA